MEEQEPTVSSTHPNGDSDEEEDLHRPLLGRTTRSPMRSSSVPARTTSIVMPRSETTLSDDEDDFHPRVDQNDEEDFPQHRGRTVAAVIFGVACGFLDVFVLSIIHERVPETPPLPDVIFDNTPYFKFGLTLAEIFMITLFVSFVVLVFLHNHRWIVVRRFFTIGGLLYFVRAGTMYVTQVPVADPTFECAPKLNGSDYTLGNQLLRALAKLSGFGLNFYGNSDGALCGDYIYSGHTIVLLLTAMFISEYSPRRCRPYIGIVAWLFAISGMLLLVLSRGHYTIDVLLSYFFTTRLFAMYHTLITRDSMRNSKHNYHSSEIWHIVVVYFEPSYNRPLPNTYGLPFDGSAVVQRFRGLLCCCACTNAVSRYCSRLCYRTLTNHDE